MFGRGICAREIVRLSTGIFRKYPFQTWYICIQFHVWLFEMGWGYGEKCHFQQYSIYIVVWNAIWLE